MADGIEAPAVVIGLAAGISFVAIIATLAHTTSLAPSDDRQRDDDYVVLLELIPSNSSLYPDALLVNVTQKILLQEPAADSFRVYEIIPEWKGERLQRSFKAVYNDEGERIRLRPFGITHELDEMLVTCPSGAIRKITYLEYGLPLATNVTGTAFFKYPITALLPSDQPADPERVAQYRLQFSSFYPTKIYLPEGQGVVESYAEEKCLVNNFEDAFFYDVEFAH